MKPKDPEPVDEVENIDLFAVCVIRKAMANEFLMRFRSIFKDMTPKILKQKKVLINQGQKQQQPNFSRLEATAIAEIPTTVNGKCFEVEFEKNLSNFENQIRVFSHFYLISSNIKNLNIFLKLFRMSLKIGMKTPNVPVGKKSMTRTPGS